MELCYSIVIPMYNETRNLASAIPALRELLDRLDAPAEVVMVNDGSTDQTAEMARRLVGEDTRFVIDGYETNRGKGSAVKYGVLAARGEVILMTDCDLAYGCDTMYDMLTALYADPTADLLIGSRNLSADGYASYTALRRMMSKAYIGLIKTVSGFHWSDSQCGIKCFRADAVRKIFPLCTVERFAIDLEVLLIADRYGMQVREFPVSVKTHDQGSSKVNPVKDTFQMLGDLRKMKKRVKALKLPM